MKTTSWYFIICMDIFILLFSIPASAQTHERWDVKTITDGFIPNMQTAKKVSVASIARIAKIGVRNTQPRLNFEKRVITITGTITRIKLETDGDYHIEVSDGTLNDSTLVCEAVNPDLPVAKKSPMVSKFTSVRTVVSNLKKDDQVIFTGILFQDKYHSPSPNRTRNFLEIHPILKAKKI